MVMKFIFDYAPLFTHPYLRLMRLDRPIGAWLLFWPAAWAMVLASHLPEMMAVLSWTLVLFGIGAIIMRGAGCVVNDLWDRNIDKYVARTASRPLATGEISPRAALIFLVMLLLMGAGILFQLSPISILLGWACLPLIALYPLMKRVTYLPQLFLGATFNFSVLIAWAAIEGSLPGAALVLYLAALCWTMAYDTIYAFQDIEDDLTIGVKSMAILFQSKPKLAVGLFYIGMFICFNVSLFYIYGHIWGGLGLIPAAGYVYYLMSLWRPNDPQSALYVFKANHYIGLLIFITLFLMQIL